MLVLKVGFLKQIRLVFSFLIFIYIKIDILNGDSYYLSYNLSNTNNIINISSDNSLHNQNQEFVENAINQSSESKGLDSIFSKDEGTIRYAKAHPKKSFYQEKIDNQDFQNQEWKSFKGLIIPSGNTLGLSLDTTNLHKSDLGKIRPDLQPESVQYILYRVDPRFEKPLVMISNQDTNIEEDLINLYKNRTVYLNPQGVQDKLLIPANKLAVFHLKEIIPQRSSPPYREYNDFYFDNRINNGGGIGYKPPQVSISDLEQVASQLQIDQKKEQYSCPSTILKRDITSGYLSSCGCQLISDADFKQLSGKEYLDHDIAVFKTDGMSTQCKKCLDIDNRNIIVEEETISIEEYDGFHIRAKWKTYNTEPDARDPDKHTHPNVTYSESLSRDSLIHSTRYFIHYLIQNKCFGETNCTLYSGEEDSLNKEKLEGILCDNTLIIIPAFAGGDIINVPLGTKEHVEGYANCTISHNTEFKIVKKNTLGQTIERLFFKQSGKEETNANDGLAQPLFYDNDKLYQNIYKENNGSLGNTKKSRHLTKKKFSEYPKLCKCRNTIVTTSDARAIIEKRGLQNRCKIKNLEYTDMAIISSESSKEDCAKILNLSSKYEWSDSKNPDKSILGYEDLKGKISYLNISDECILSPKVGTDSNLYAYTGLPSNTLIKNTKSIELCSSNLKEENLCLYNQGAGFIINSSIGVLKHLENQFADNQFKTINHFDQLEDQKKFFYYLNDTKNNVDINLETSLLIEHMFLPAEITQLAKNWKPSHVEDFTKVRNTPLNVLFLHFGSYLMRMEVYPIAQHYNRLKLEYIFSSTPPKANTKGNYVYFDAHNPEPVSVFSSSNENQSLWYRLYSESSNDQKSESLGINSGSVILNVETIKKSNFFSSFIYNNIILYLIEAIKETVAGSFSYLSQDTILKQIVITITTLYVIFYGFFFITGIVVISANDIIQRLIKISLIFAIFFNQESWNFFNNYLFNIFLEGYEQITSALISDDFIVSGEEVNPFSWVDILLGKFFSNHTISMILSQLVESFGYFIITIILIAGIFKFLLMIFRVTVEYIISFSMLAITISISPLFFMLILFEYTRKFFLQWAKMMLGFFLFAIILILLVLLVSTVFDTFFNKALIPQESKIHTISIPINLLIIKIEIPLFSFSQYHPLTSVQYTPDHYNPTKSFTYSLLFYISGNICAKVSSTVSSLIRSILGLEVYVYK